MKGNTYIIKTDVWSCSSLLLTLENNGLGKTVMGDWSMPKMT